MKYIEIVLLIVVIVLLVKKEQLKPLKTTKIRRLILDSSGLIDGRIVDLAKSGFVPNELILPQFILQELQLLADGNDSLKRERARFGLDVARELQDTNGVEVIIDRTDYGRMPTDDKLVNLAKKIAGDLYTTDFNLNKVAAIEGIKVLNVNELAQNLRPSVLPGEHRRIKVIQKGSNRKQGVGYLDDGTMVVIENAASLIGKTLEIEVERMHQTMAGKMVFGHLIGNQQPDEADPINERLRHSSRR